MIDSEQKKLLYVFESGPYTTAAGAEALDAVLIGASFEQDVALLFLHDGVFQIKRGQIVPQADESITHMKTYTKAFKALEDFDVSNVFAHDLSLLARGLTPADLMINVKTLTSNHVAELIANHDQVFTF